ncbi:MAG: 23S rRNA (pseudouridine(1915)-N(3))-methyltransferase RlmH [Deltaproteobacteria bacterium]|nr:23S rRNA (pseudouridine(1915)-N(3))-methyltransferase RlmH [Deltaproteobacteria bacterium]
MPGLRVLCVGKTDKGFVADGVDFYLKRIRAFQPLEWVEVKPASHSGRQPEESLAREAGLVLKRLADTDPLVLLDERGQRLDSRQFAGVLGSLGELGAGMPSFVIGGAYGVDDSLRRRSTHVLSLSPLTFPHQLVRLVLLEQIYRGLTILAGHGYHHD